MIVFGGYLILLKMDNLFNPLHEENDYTAKSMPGT
jgi:hypothetical protein